MTIRVYVGKFFCICFKHGHKKCLIISLNMDCDSFTISFLKHNFYFSDVLFFSAHNLGSMISQYIYIVFVTISFIHKLLVAFTCRFQNLSLLCFLETQSNLFFKGCKIKQKVQIEGYILLQWYLLYCLTCMNVNV